MFSKEPIQLLTRSHEDFITHHHVLNHLTQYLSKKNKNLCSSYLVEKKKKVTKKDSLHFLIQQHLAV